MNPAHTQLLLHTEMLQAAEKQVQPHPAATEKTACNERTCTSRAPVCSRVEPLLHLLQARKGLVVVVLC